MGLYSELINVSNENNGNFSVVCFSFCLSVPPDHCFSSRCLLQRRMSRKPSFSCEISLVVVAVLLVMMQVKVQMWKNEV